MFYNFGIYLYGLAVHIAALWDAKAKAWVKGRKNWRTELQAEIDPSKDWYWFHCASLGEFEQGRPLIEALRERKPEAAILLTFFSPSGYEIRKNYEVADHVAYLPLDTPRNARDFLHTVSPKAAIFVKYEFWANYLLGLDDALVPRYLVSATFRPQQHFFKWYGSWYRRILRRFETIFVQDQEVAKLLEKIRVESVVAGDTRFDRVVEVVQKTKDIPMIEEFATKPVLVVGSSWPKDEQLLAAAIKDLDIKTIIVPHEVTHDHVVGVQALFPNGLRFSEAKLGQMADTDVLIVDQIGLLSRIYRYAAVSYIGGGFGKGIHNTLEAAAWDVPVCFGPRYHKFKEAVKLVECGAAASVKTKDELQAVLKNWFENEADRQKAGEQAGHFVRVNAGATSMIMTALLAKVG